MGDHRVSSGGARPRTFRAATALLRRPRGATLTSTKPADDTALGNWVNKHRVEHAGDEPPSTLPERARLRELERENRELRMKTEFLGKAAAFFAQEYR